MTLPDAGDVVRLDRAASVQFEHRPIWLRVIRVDTDTYDGWVWLEGYELDQAGDAVERRQVFAQIAGLFREPRRAPIRRTVSVPARARQEAPAPLR